MTDAIIERLVRIETNQTITCEKIDKIAEKIYGNGREGLCDRVTRCEQDTEDNIIWRNKHEKNIKFYIVIGISVVTIIQGLIVHFLK